MSNLVHIGNGEQALAQGGIGFSGSMFRLKPATIELTQKMSRGEGAIPGKLRLPATNEHFSEMKIVLLFPPQEKRTYWPKGSDFGAEPLCRSNDGVTPAETAKAPQALACANCPHNDWTKWKKTKQRDDLPQCKNGYEILFIDRETELPYRMTLKGTSIDPLREAMQHIARLAQLLQKQGKNPNIFDFSMTIRPVGKSGNSYFVVQFSDIALIKEEDKAKFGKFYLDFAARKAQVDRDEETKDAEAEVDAAVSGKPASSGPVEGEYVQV